MYLNVHRVLSMDLTGRWDSVAKAIYRMLRNIHDQLKPTGLHLPGSIFYTHTELGKLESYTIANHEDSRFSDRRTLLAEYRRVINLGRQLIAETPAAAQAAIDRICKDQKTKAAHRLRQRMDFSLISSSLIGGDLTAKSHPKIGCLCDLLDGEASRGRKSLVLCTTRDGADELAEVTARVIGRPAVALHSRLRKRRAKENLRSFESGEAAIAIATATLDAKLGLVADSVIHYHLLSMDAAYISRITPKPRYQYVVIAARHRLDLGSSVRVKLSAPRPVRRRRGEDTQTLPLPFHRDAPLSDSVPST